MAETEDVVISDLLKMKVADLKRELKARGLSTAGNKNELIERLQGVGEDNSTVRTAVSTDTDGEISATVDTDGLDESGNHEEELLDEDDVLEDGLDDELSVEGISETNESAGVLSINITDSLISSASSVQQSKPISKRKLMGPSKKVESTRQPPKKITLNRNTSISSMVASEKENHESVNQDKSMKSTAESKETNESEPPKKVVKLSGISVKERLELRAQKFGVPVSETAKKEARAIRFGISGSQTSSVPVASAEVLKKRAERFGTAVSPILKKSELEEKLKQRQQRFGVVASSNNNGLSGQAKGNLEEKKRLRAERFKITNV